MNVGSAHRVRPVSLFIRGIFSALWVCVAFVPGGMIGAMDNPKIFAPTSRRDHHIVTPSQQPEGVLQCFDERADTPLHAAARTGEVDFVCELIESGAAVNARDTRGATPLHDAAERNRADVIGPLVAGCAHVDSRNCCGDTPLHSAAKHGCADAAQALLDVDASCLARNKACETPLHIAARSGFDNVVANIVNDADKRRVLGTLLAMKDRQGATPLHAAARAGQGGVLGTILAWARVRGLVGRVLAEGDENGDSPLHLAAWLGRVAAVSVILGNGAAINGTNFARQTPLHLAAITGKVDVINMLMRAAYDRGIGRRTLLSCDGANQIPLHMAAWQGERAALDALIAWARHSGVYDEVLEAQSTAGRTVLHQAALSRMAASRETFDELLKIRNQRPYRVTRITPLDVLLLLDYEEYRYKAEDEIGALTESLIVAVCNADPSPIVASSSLLHNWMRLYAEKNVEKALEGWSVFTTIVADESSGPGDFVVLIPPVDVAMEELGTSSLLSVLGLHDEVLRRIENGKLRDFFRTLPACCTSFDVHHLCAIFSRESTRPTRFIVQGHGTRETFAGVDLGSLGALMALFNGIRAQFVLFVTCFGGSAKLVALQKIINGMIGSRRRSMNTGVRMPKNRAYYSTVVQSTLSNLRRSGVFKNSSSSHPRQCGAKRARESLRLVIAAWKMAQALTWTREPSGLNYFVAVVATADNEVRSFIPFQHKFFRRLDAFLDTYHHARAQAHEGDKLSQGLGYTLKAFYDGSPDLCHLASVRFPGTRTFFRAARVDDMEVITYPRIQKILLESCTEPGAKGRVCDATINVARHVKYVQVYPCDLSRVNFMFDRRMDTTNTRSGITAPLYPIFISRMPSGPASHFIKSVTWQAPGGLCSDDELKKFVLEAFIRPLWKLSGPRAKAWFIGKIIIVTDEGAVAYRHVVIHKPDTSSSEQSSWGLNRGKVPPQASLSYVDIRGRCEHHMFLCLPVGDVHDRSDTQWRCNLGFPGRWTIDDYCVNALKVFGETRAGGAALGEASAYMEGPEEQKEAFEGFFWETSTELGCPTTTRFSCAHPRACPRQTGIRHTCASLPSVRNVTS